MVPVFKLDPTKIKTCSREEHLARLERWFEAQAKLEAICKERGIPVPVMVC